MAEDVIQALEGSDFENLLNMSGIGLINQCAALVKQLVRCYDEDSHCFVVGEGVSLYFGLVDVLCIVGLPICGIPLIGTECHVPLISQELFESIPDVFRDKKGFVLSVLKNTAMNDECPLAIMVRATVLFLLGCTIIPDSSTICVKALYGTFLRDVEDIKKYAWGEVCLTEIHDGLVEYKSKLANGKDPSIRGSMFALTIFALIRIKPLRVAFGVVDENLPSTWPLMVDWARTIKPILRNPYANPNTNTINNIFNCLTTGDIDWQPYATIAYNMAVNYKKMMNMSLEILTMFKNEVCLYHTPHVVPEQFQLSMDLQQEMESWLSTNMARRTHIHMRLKGTQGIGNKNYMILLSKKLGGDVIEIRNKFCHQTWIDWDDGSTHITTYQRFTHGKFRSNSAGAEEVHQEQEFEYPERSPFSDHERTTNDGSIQLATYHRFTHGKFRLNRAGEEMQQEQYHHEWSAFSDHDRIMHTYIHSE